jgi:hypothetical protein
MPVEFDCREVPKPRDGIFALWQNYVTVGQRVRINLNLLFVSTLCVDG